MACSPGSPAPSMAVADVGSRTLFPHWLLQVDVELGERSEDQRLSTRDVTEMVLMRGPLGSLWDRILSLTAEICSGTPQNP